MRDVPAVDLAARHRGGAQDRVNRIVIHATSPGTWSFPRTSAAGNAWDTARYLSTTTRTASAHTVSDVSRTVRCVPENVVAYHAPPNLYTLGNEICGHAAYTRAQWLDDDVWPAVENCARETAAQAARWSVPVVKLTAAQVAAGARGIGGHVDVSEAHGKSDHWDPGPGFPWPEFINAVKRHANPDQEEDDMNPAQDKRLKDAQDKAGKAWLYSAKAVQLAEANAAKIDQILDALKAR